MSDELPFPQSLCHRCVNLRLVRTKTSTFLMCLHPELPKYPRQPIVSCRGFAPRDISPPDR
jgi:hypothetical protein